MRRRREEAVAGGTEVGRGLFVEGECLVKHAYILGEREHCLT